MNSFANDERTNKLDMPRFMKALIERQRDAIAHYLAGLQACRALSPPPCGWFLT
jgi:hypothetical protein